MTHTPTRAQRLAMPLARDVVRELAVTHGGCVRPVQLRRTDLHTGQVEQVLVPCGHTLATVCPSCAERAKTLRAAQCREGWHLDHEPIAQADEPDDEQRMWVETARRGPGRPRPGRRGRAGHRRAGRADRRPGRGDHPLRGARQGHCPPSRPAVTGPPGAARTPRTCPGARSTPRTVGKTYTAPDGKTFRPSMFLTLTCPSYGRVGERRHPGRPGRLRLPAGRPGRAALRRAVRPVHPEPAPLPRLRRPVLRRRRTPAAPGPARPHRDPRHHLPHRAAPGPRRHLPPGLVATHRHRSSTTTASLPVWHEASGNYLDPATGEVLPTWDQALDAIGDDDEPLHVARFGDRFDAQGVLAGSRDANRCIGYLTKYLTKHVADCHQAAHRRPARRTPSGSPTRCGTSRARRPCANWLRYGIQPKNPRPGLRPGHCKGKAHRREHLGYAGRRVLVSRKWSGKTLADHRADRKALAPRHPRHSRPPTRPATPGNPSPPATPTTCHPPNGCCTSSPTASLARRARPKPGARANAQADLSATGRAA